MTQHVLIGGTGAVGSVYAYYLQRGGHRVSLFVRPKRRAPLQKQGYLVLHDLTSRWWRSLGLGVGIGVVTLLLSYVGVGAPLLWSVSISIAAAVGLHRLIPVSPAPHRLVTGFQVTSDLKQLGSSGASYVWLCISSSQLREPGFIESVTSQLDDHQILVSLTPGHSDVDYIASHWPHRERIIAGTIPIISYQAPLVGERWHPTSAYVPVTGGAGADADAETVSLQNGIAVFVPAGAKVFFSGDAHNVQPILDAMNAGGLPSILVKGSAHLPLLVPSSVLTCLLMALEVEDWSWAKFRTSTALTTTAQAAKEMIVLVHSSCGVPAPRLVMSFIHPVLFHAIMLFSPLVMPFDLEPYIQYHFTKVGSQTVLFMSRMLEYAQQHDLPHTALQTLATKLHQKQHPN